MRPLIPEMVEYVQDRSGFSGNLGLILGSGLGSFADQLKDPVIIPYEDIPGYPRSTVEGHSGQLITGTLNGIPLLAAKGRFHFYEGYDFHTVTLPIHLFHGLGVCRMVITNAAGSLQKELVPGTLMAIEGHRDCTFRHDLNPAPLRSGPPYHDPALLVLVEESARKAGVHLARGVYCWTLGPAYETPAEIIYFRELGGNAVGMSTVPEIISAAELGIQVLGISCLTNYAAGIVDQPLTHEEVIQTADAAGGQFSALLSIIVKEFSF